MPRLSLLRVFRAPNRVTHAPPCRARVRYALLAPRHTDIRRAAHACLSQVLKTPTLAHYPRTIFLRALRSRARISRGGSRGRHGGDAWFKSQSPIAGRSRTMGAHPLVSQRYIYREHHPHPCAREVEVDFDFHAWRAFRRARATRATLETFKFGCLHPAWPCSSLSNVCRE